MEKEKYIDPQKIDTDELISYYNSGRMFNYFSDKLSYDDFANVLLKDYCAFFSNGGTTTFFKSFTDKQLLDAFLSKDYDSLDDMTKQLYFQEYHNRVAKKLGTPPVDLKIMENSKNLEKANPLSSGGFQVVTPFHYIAGTPEPVENMNILIRKQPLQLSSLLGVPVKIDNNGLCSLYQIAHETRHLYQQYNTSLLFSTNRQKNNYDNAISFYGVVGNCFNALLKKDSQIIFPKIKNENSMVSKDMLCRYYLNPKEIDARKYSFEEVEKLYKANLLDNTNWEKYRMFVILNEYSILNLGKDTAQDICPAINYLRKLKQNYLVASKQLNLNKFHDKIDSANKQIDFDEYFNNLQKYYDSLKAELKQIAVNTANDLKDYDKSPNIEFINKLKSGKCDSLDYTTLRACALYQITDGRAKSNTLTGDKQINVGKYQKKSQQKLDKIIKIMERHNPSTNEHSDDLVFLSKDSLNK